MSPPPENANVKNYAELTVTNLDYNISTKEWKKILFTIFKQHVQVRGCSETGARWAKWFSNRLIEYWATRSSVCLFAHTAHSFARSLTLLTPSLVGKRFFNFCMKWRAACIQFQSTVWCSYVTESIWLHLWANIEVFFIFSRSTFDLCFYGLYGRDDCPPTIRSWGWTSLLRETVLPWGQSGFLLWTTPGSPSLSCIATKWAIRGKIVRLHNYLMVARSHARGCTRFVCSYFCFADSLGLFYKVSITFFWRQWFMKNKYTFFYSSPLESTSTCCPLVATADTQP